MKNKKTSALIMMILLLINSFSIVSSAENTIPESVIAKARKGVAYVLNTGYDSYYDSSISRGSAVAIGIKGEPVKYFLTCYHCVADSYGKETDGTIFVGLGDMAAPEYSSKAKIVKSNPDYDYAILEAETGMSNYIPIVLREEAVAVSEPIVFALGFSGESMIGDKPYASPDTLAYADGKIVVTDYDILYRNPYEHTIKGAVQSTTRLVGGFSGGAICDINGNLIGLSEGTESYKNSDGTIGYKNSYFVSLNSILSDLDMLEIPYQLCSNGEVINKNTNIETNLPPTSTGSSQHIIPYLDDDNESLDSKLQEIIDNGINENKNDDTTSKKGNSISLIPIIISIPLVVCIVVFVCVRSRNNKKSADNNSDSNERSIRIVKQVKKTNDTDSTKTKTVDLKSFFMEINRLCESNGESEFVNRTTIDAMHNYLIQYNNSNVLELCINKQKIKIKSYSLDYPVFIVEQSNTKEPLNLKSDVETEFDIEGILIYFNTQENEIYNIMFYLRKG